MHKYCTALFFLLLLLSASWVWGQKSGQTRVDSLLTVLSKAKQDTARIYTMDDLFNTYVNLDEDKLAPLADKMISLAAHLNWQEGLVIGYLDAGDALLYKKDFSGAMDNYRKSLMISRAMNNIPLVKKCRIKIVDDFNAQDNEKSAISFLNGELAAVKPADDLGTASILNFIGKEYIRMANYTEAMRYLERSLVLVQKTGFKRGIASIADNMANVYYGTGDYNEAMEYYLKALPLYKELHIDQDIANTSLGIGNTYTMQGDYLKALTYDLAALKIEEVYNDKIQLSAINGNIALLYGNLGNYDEALKSSFKRLKLLQDIGNQSDIATENDRIGDVYLSEGNYNDALNYYLKALKICERTNNKAGIADNISCIGNIYDAQGEKQKALANFNTALGMYRAINNKSGIAGQVLNIAGMYKDQGKSDVAMEGYKSALKDYTELNNRNGIAKATECIAAVYSDLQQNKLALEYDEKALKIYEDMHDVVEAAHCEGNIGDTQLHIALDSETSPGDKKKEFLLAIGSLERASAESKRLGLLDNYQRLSRDLSYTYEKNSEYDKALAAYKEFIIYRDSVFNQRNTNEITKRELQYDFGKREDSIKYKQAETAGLLKQQTLLATQQKQALLINGQQLSLATQQREVQRLNFLKTQADLTANKSKLKSSQKEQALTETTLRLQGIELDSKRTQSRFFIGGLVILILLSFFIALNYYNQRKATATIVLANQQTEIQRQTAEKRLQELIVTQNQLVQAEKLASLGELTAGIAHEIQNPLNFVNNFSEVNTELLDEMQEEIESGNMTEVQAIATDIRANQLKISQHGKRADFIVKGMLQHSRVSTGERQLSDINIMVEEFIKLSYQAQRTKDKSFNAAIVTSLQPDLPRISIVQQDIGRVLLNLFNNAFYAINQKQKQAIPGYKPEVEVNTSYTGGMVLISVKDNGNGIPDSIKEKIMQPFFTTKPTGEGTGLGLSLSYDIISKGHGGKITVTSRENEGAEFAVELPAT